MEICDLVIPAAWFVSCFCFFLVSKSQCRAACCDLGNPWLLRYFGGFRGGIGAWFDGIDVVTGVLYIDILSSFVVLSISRPTSTMTFLTLVEAELILVIFIILFGEIIV